MFEQESLSALIETAPPRAPLEVEPPRLEFRDGQFFFRSNTIEGGVVERYLSDAAVREAFSRVPVDSGWLRPEIARWGDGKKGEWAVAFFPPQVHELELSREVPEAETQIDRLHVPLPGLVWFGMGTRYFVWAVKTPVLQPYQEIYIAPLPNVYTDGKVCWGLVQPPRCNARSIFDAWDLFIRSTFNNHLASGKSKSSPDDVRKTLRLAAEMLSNDQVESYALDDLMRQVPHTGVTLDQAIRTWMEKGEMPE